MSGYVLDRANTAFLVVFSVILVLLLVDFFATMLISPIGFDESFNLQAPLNLVQGNGYATENWQYGGDKLLFRAIVSTGPAVELPVALSFVIFGTTIEAARIVMLPYFALLIVCVFVLGRRFAGRWGGAVATAMLLALDTRVDWPSSVVYGPSDVLGEYAAAALIALGLVLLPRRRMLAGLAIGFAALAKFIAFLAAPAFIIALLLIPAVGAAMTRRARIREIVGFVVLVALPSLGWELVKLVSLGFTGYGGALIDYLRFVFRSGSGADGGTRAFFADRFGALFIAWHLPGGLVLACAVPLFAMALLGISRYWAGPETQSLWRKGTKYRAIRTATTMIPVELMAAIGVLAVFAVWWTFIASSQFVRHTTPVLLAIVPLAGALAVRGANWLISERGPGWRAVGRTFLVGLATVIAVQASFTMESAFRAEEWTRDQQVRAAQFIRDLGVEEVQGIGWWAAPELRFLSHVPSTPVGTGTGPLVLEPILRTLDPATYDKALDLCVEILYDEDGFVICTIDPRQGPVELGGG